LPTHDRAPSEGAPAGASIDNSTGVFNWTPTEAQGPGSYTFSLQVSDGSLTDFEEITVTVGDLYIRDTDGDGLSDGDEMNSYGTDPNLIDTDGDGAWDSVEVAAGSDPSLDQSRPQISFVEKGTPFSESPCWVNTVFQLKDEFGKGVSLPRAIIDQGIGPFVVLDENNPISPSESFADIDKFNEVPAAMKTILLLDNSFSMATRLETMKSAAKDFVASIFPNQEIAIYSFSGSLTLMQEYTNDIDALNAAIDSISIGGVSTNLYGSIFDLLDTPSESHPTRWSEEVGLSGIKTGVLVAFTDGMDTSGLKDLSEVITIRDAEQKEVYTVGLGTEIDSSALTEIGNAAFYQVADVAELNDVFVEIQQEIKKSANSFYWLNYASPRRGDFDRSLVISISGNANQGEDRQLTTIYNSSGYSDLAPGVYLNRTVYNANGIDSLQMPLNSEVPLTATTILPVSASTYEWSLGNDTLSEIVAEPETNGARVVIQATGNSGTTTLSVVDRSNEDLLPGYYTKAINFIVGTTLVDWKNDFFTIEELADVSISGELADPDDDGLINLLEYAFGLSPKVADPVGNMTVGTEDDSGSRYFTFSYRRNPNAADLDFEIMSSPDLLDWFAAVIESTTVVDDDIDGDGQAELIKVRLEMTDPKTFLRLSVTK